MAFNYATGQYEPDQPAQVQQAGPTINDWLRLAGFDPNMNYATTAQPNPNPAGPAGTVAPAPTAAGYPGHNGDPTVTTPLPMGTVSDGTNTPGGVNFNRPTVVPDIHAPGMQDPSWYNQGQQQQSPLQIFSQNAGNDPNNPTLKGDFWSNTAGRWVDPTYGTDSTGRVLSDAEKQYWQGYDHARASGTLDSYLKTVTNPGLAAGTQATYAPGVATKTIPGRFLDQAGAPGATPAAAGPAGPAGVSAAAATSANPLDPAWDYSKPGSVPWQAFVKNLFADTNAQQSFKELQGVLTPEQIQTITEQYGWQPIPNSASPDANAIYRAGIQAAQADPTSDYSIVQMQAPGGQIAYGLMKREQGTAAQEARGFYAPGSTNPNSPANQARARAASYSRGRSGTGAEGPGKVSGVTQDQLNAAAGMKGLGKGVMSTAARILTDARNNAIRNAGVQEQAKYNARYQGYTPPPTAPGGMPLDQHDAQLAAQKKLLDAMTGGAGAVTGALPGNYNGKPTVPAPAGNPPEGAVRVNPDDTRDVWHNGHWVRSNYQPNT